jgi:hypothetical protein
MNAARADVDFALGQLTERLSSRSVRLALMILIQAIRNAMVNDLVVRNGADLAAVPTGKPGRPSVRRTGETKTESSRRVFQLPEIVPLPSRSVRCWRTEETPTEAKTEPLGFQIFIDGVIELMSSGDGGD